MAVISLFSTSLSLRPHNYPTTPLYPSSCLKTTSLPFQSHPLRKKTSLKKTVFAIAEEETLAAEVEQTVTVPVSPSDSLTMFFKAEGTMDDTAISNLDKALKGKDGVSDLKVQNIEGIASVEEFFTGCFIDCNVSLAMMLTQLEQPVRESAASTSPEENRWYALETVAFDSI